MRQSVTRTTPFALILLATACGAPSNSSVDLDDTNRSASTAAPAPSGTSFNEISSFLPPSPLTAPAIRPLSLLPAATAVPARHATGDELLYGAAMLRSSAGSREFLVADDAPPAAPFYDKLLPKSVKDMMELAKQLGDLISGFSSAASTAQALLQSLGLLQAPESAVELKIDALKKEMEQLVQATDYHNIATARSDKLQSIIADSIYIHEQLLQHGSVPTTDSVNLLSIQAVKELTGEPYFQRLYVESATDAPNTGAPGGAGQWNDWKKVITDRAQIDPGGLVYDWRLNVPVLMSAIALRLKIIATMSPDFKATGLYSQELTAYRDTLLSHYNRMNDGIRCNVWQLTNPGMDQANPDAYDWYAACADINSGHFHEVELSGNATQAGVAWPPPADTSQCNHDWGDDSYQNCVSLATAQAYQGWASAVAAPTLAKLRNQMVLDMPMFELRSMIDSLYFDEVNQEDLTQMWFRIPVAANSNLCLDVQWGSAVNGTPVWLWNCTGNAAQKWSYDRATGVVHQHAFANKCLDVRGVNSTSGTPLQIWDCIDGDLAQLWTYDPEKQVLQSALGKVMDIQWGNIAKGTPVWIWDRYENDAQRFKADPPLSFPH
jgi:hypothetical protein